MIQLEYSVEKPLNREPELEKLVSSFITKEGGYDRNHGPIPHLDAATHQVCVYGLVTKELHLHIKDLQELPQHNVICALQCAGNRRHTMRTKLKEVSGIDWFDGAVMNCKWTGPLLKDVLNKAGLKVKEDEWKDAHVAFLVFPDADSGRRVLWGQHTSVTSHGPQQLNHPGSPDERQTSATQPWRASRVVTPGIAGARSVKWLDRITVQTCESSSYYQQHDYKILPPEADCKEKAEEWWGKVDAIQEMPINSVIGVPKNGAKVQRDEDGAIEVKGYALPSGSDGPIAKVEVTADGGETWVDAELEQSNGDEDVELKWAWTLWKARVKVGKGKDVTIYSKATDRSGHTQEKTVEWNFRGVGYNAWGEASGIEVI